MIRKLVDWLLVRYCNRRLHEAISGDLEELYDRDLVKLGPKQANRNYLINSIAFLRYHRLRKGKTTKTHNNMSLIKNYVKVSWRDLLRHKMYTSIHLIGLVSAMTVSLMILEYVVYETGFDRFHTDYNRIYRVVNDRYQKGELIQHGTITYPTIGPTLAEDLPEVQSYTRIVPDGRNYIDFNNDLYLSDEVLYADEHFLDFFSFTLLHGDSKTALSQPYQAVLTQSFARRMAENAPLDEMIGRTILVSGEPVTISAIIEDVPVQSHLQFDLLVSYKTYIDLMGEGADNSWRWSDFYHYVKLREGTQALDLNPKLAEFGKRYFKDGEVTGSVEKFFLQPLGESHLDTSMQYEFCRVVNGRIVWTMLIIAAFILLVAWINYVNLTTSRVLQRAKEVGVRKSIGANRSHIIFQFTVETLSINVLALLISLGLAWVLQPLFNELVALDLHLSILWDSTFFGVPFFFLFVAIFTVTLIAISLYPALLLAGFKARDVITGKYKSEGKVVLLRKGLVAFQFITAIALINGAIAISDQVEYMLSKDLGLEIDNTMVVYGTAMTNWDSTFMPNLERFRNEVEQLQGVKMVSMSNRVAGERMGRLFRVKNHMSPNHQNLALNFMNVDYNFQKLYGLEILEGRGFEVTDHNFSGDLVDKLIINESAVSYLGFKSISDAVGATLNFGNRDWMIIGIVEDYHQLTLHERIEPLALLPYLSTFNGYSIKLIGEPHSALISSIQERYDRIFPGNYFDYFFLSDQYAQYYQPEMRLRVISKVFTALSIVMVMLGLYGLTSMTLEKKVKEIGIRKVLGAKLSQLLFLLVKDFAFLMCIALFVGIPLSFYFIELWKADFAYSSQLGVRSIIAACALVLTFTSLPIIVQTGRIANHNPVQALRDE